jgi:superfamily II DNA or RNA helicase
VSAHAPRSLRAWQQAALETYEAKGEPKDFLVTATPGAGKTTFALTFAGQMLQRRLVSRVIVVVPTDHLRKQWADAAHAMGIDLDPTLSNDVGPVSVDFHGYVATYAQVAQRPMLHRARTERVPTLVILDEVHHAGDGLSWGDAVREAFEPARRRLELTGTPFRSKSTETIPFVRYEDHDGDLISRADYTYGYSNALADNVVRPVLFVAYSGVARWRDSAGEVVAASLSDPLSKAKEMTAWRTALNPAGQWIAHVIAAADDRLTEVRAAGMGDAGAMILASDQEDARAYAQIIEKVTGHKPTVVLSEDPKASTRIGAFSASNDRWLVAVRMVSEGVDVPRLAVGIWATNYRTPLFFAQAVGRFVRSRRKGETATVFLPAVRPLLTLAAEMERERDHVIAAAKPKDEDEEALLDEVDESAEQALNSLGGYEALDAEAEFAHVLFGGAAHTGDIEMSEISDDDQEFLGLPGLLDPSQMAALLRQRDTTLRKTVQVKAEPEVTPAQVQQVHKQASDLRREINQLVGSYAARTQTPHAQVHKVLRRAVPGPASASASAAQLQARRDHLLTLLHA